MKSVLVIAAIAASLSGCNTFQQRVENCMSWGLSRAECYRQVKQEDAEYHRDMMNRIDRINRGSSTGTTCHHDGYVTTCY